MGDLCKFSPEHDLAIRMQSESTDMQNKEKAGSHAQGPLAGLQTAAIILHLHDKPLVGYCVPGNVASATNLSGQAAAPQTAASSASSLSMAGLMPAGRSRSLGGFDLPKEPRQPSAQQASGLGPVACWGWSIVSGLEVGNW
jgi:hypothetical protein